MDDPNESNSTDLKELIRAVRELSLRVQKLERLVDDERLVRGPDLDPDGVRQRPFPAKQTHDALESRIGSQWLNRIGVIAVLFGVAYLLRYAFVKQWVSVAAWVWMGASSGLAIILGSEWFRRRGYRVLSLSLKATGIGVSYLSLWAGLELYALLSGAQTFVGLVALTVLGAVLALRESAEVLAGLALIGGFLTPLLISIPVLELPLFIYIAVLDCAAAFIVLKRDWLKLFPLALGGTILLSSTWYFGHYRRSELEAAVIAATLFFIIFFATAALLRQVSPVRPIGVALTEVANAAVYFGSLYLLMDQRHHDALAMFALGLAAAYFLLAWRVERGVRFAATRLVALYGGLGIVFIAIMLAILVSADWLSLAWFLEAATLVAIGFWRDWSWLRWGGLLLLCAAIIKAFAYDVWRLGLAYRTLSFIGLGVLLLVISFAYQRYGFSMISKGKGEAGPLP